MLVLTVVEPTHETAEVLEEAIHYELSRFVPTSPMHAALRNRLRNANRTSAPRKASATAIKRLEDQLDRARRLFEYGEYDWDMFCKRRDEITAQKRQRCEAVATPEALDLEWCESQLLDLTSAWEAADQGQRSRLVAGIFEHLEAETLPEGTLRVVAVPREAWRPFFERLVLERETGLPCSTPSAG